MESASLASVRPPPPLGRLRLPLQTFAEGRLSDAQVEALVHACSQVLRAFVQRASMRANSYSTCVSRCMNVSNLMKLVVRVCASG